MPVVLEFTGTPEGLERLRKAIESGELRSLAGFQILGQGTRETDNGFSMGDALEQAKNLKPGDRIDIDVRDTFASESVWVPAVFEAHAERVAEMNMMDVRIDAPEGHPWHQHNAGPLHRCQTTYWRPRA